MNRLSGRFGQLLRALSGEEDPSKTPDKEDKLHESNHHARPPAFAITSPLEDQDLAPQDEEDRHSSMRHSVPRSKAAGGNIYDPFAGPIKVRSHCRTERTYRSASSCP